MAKFISTSPSASFSAYASSSSKSSDRFLGIALEEELPLVLRLRWRLVPETVAVGGELGLLRVEVVFSL